MLHTIPRLTLLLARADHGQEVVQGDVPLIAVRSIGQLGNEGEADVCAVHVLRCVVVYPVPVRVQVIFVTPHHVLGVVAAL